MTTEAELNARGEGLGSSILGSAELVTFKGNTRPTTGALWFRLAVSLDQRIGALAGVDWQSRQLSATKTSVTVKVSAELRKWCADYGCIHDVSDAEYFVELNEAGWLGIQYQHISGGRRLAWLSQEQVDRFCNRMAEGLRKAGRQVLTEVSSRSTNGVGKRDEVGLLTVEDNTIRLPQEHLKSYAAIKSAIEKAGGSYNVGGYFTFPDGIEAAQVLAGMNGGKTTNVKQETQFFATSGKALQRVCDAVDQPSGKRFLEPSAGDGAIADELVSRGGTVVVVENWIVNVKKLQAKGYDVIDSDFLDLRPSELGLFDAIVANPPFTRGQDIVHARHMWHFLKPGGVLSIVMSPGWQRGTQRRQVEFKAFVEAHAGEVTEIEAGAFSAAGTGVATVHVVLRKPLAPVGLGTSRLGCETADLFA